MRNSQRLWALWVALVCMWASPAVHAVPVGGCDFTLTSYPGVYYNVSLPSAAQASRVVVNCTSLLTVVLSKSITVQYGAGSSGNLLGRRMPHPSDGTSLLGYSLRTSSSPSSSILGDGTAGTTVHSGTVNCLIAVLGVCTLGTPTVTFDAFLHIPSGQYVRKGTYADSVVVTVIVN